MIKRIQQTKLVERKRLKELKEKGTGTLSKEEMKELLDLIIDIL